MPEAMNPSQPPSVPVRRRTPPAATGPVLRGTFAVYAVPCSGAAVDYARTCWSGEATAADAAMHALAPFTLAGLKYEARLVVLGGPGVVPEVVLDRTTEGNRSLRAIRDAVAAGKGAA